eukprot:gene18087-biopygen41112
MGVGGVAQQPPPSPPSAQSYSKQPWSWALEELGDGGAGKLKTGAKTGVKVVVSEEFLTHSEKAVALKKGLSGTVERFDEDGDAWIAFAAPKKSQLVKQKNFDKLDTGDV